ncbi:MAG: PD-(D/E)XK nuclease family protein [Clostridia bacterium]|nr:PD-(D/E)XK nuclease family protein [Clostridia bacterium]
MGGLLIVQGRANSGKRAFLKKRLLECMKQGKKAVFLVPEQATFETERELAREFSGLLGIEVLSFSRLCERILSETEQSLPYLSAQGRNMVIRRAIIKRREELLLYGAVAQKNAFADRIDALISQFKQAKISPQQLSAVLDELEPRSLLYQKLHDICLLYETSEDYLQTRYLTANDELALAAERFCSSHYLGKEFFIDGFDNPSRAVYDFMELLLSQSARVTISLRIDPQADEPLFQPDMRARDRLVALAVQQSVPVAFVDMPSKQICGALDHMERFLFASEPQAFLEDSGEISLFTLPDRRSEAGFIADMVLKRVREGKRYRDIAVICPDLSNYGELIRRAFLKRGIPLFYDARAPLGVQPAARFVLLAIRAASGGYNIKNVLALAKSGFLRLDLSEVEIFENYVLRYGIFGSALIKPFDFGEIPAEAEKVRAELIEPLSRLHEGLLNKTVADKTRAVLGYLEDTGFFETLNMRAEELQSEGRGAKAQLLLQIQSVLSELFAQLEVILGGVSVSMAEFLTMTEQGMAAYDIGVVPDSFDAVTLGDVERSRLLSRDTLFIIGVNEGSFPRAQSDDEILGDAELGRMEELGLPVWNDAYARAQNDRLELYSLLTRARERLCLTFAASNAGEALSPSLLIARLRSIFPNLTIGRADETELPLCRSTAFSRLISEYRLYGREGAHTELLPALIEAFSNDESYRLTLLRILSGELLNFSPAALGRATAETLYGKSVRMSASRLEQFNRCPFAHFGNYGLKAEERKVAKEDLKDVGSFVHEVLDAFVKYIKENNLDWNEIDDERADAIVDGLLPARVEAHNDGILLRNVRLKESLFLLEIRIKLACRSIAKQVRLSAFAPLKTEFRFGGDKLPPIRLTTDGGRPVELRGIVDRIDFAEVEGETLLRVVDYKLGNRKLEPEKIESGETLQLPLYLKAAKSLGGEGAGMYYMPTTMPVSDSEQEEDAVHRLYGVTASDEVAIEATERIRNKKSEYIGGLSFKDGAASGAVCSREELNHIVELATVVASATVDRMYTGEARVYPTKSACDYCPYLSVCRFDPELGGRTRMVAPKRIADIVGRDET